MPLSSTVKVLVAGDRAVGKTSLIQSVLDMEFCERYTPTDDNWYSTSMFSAGGEKYRIQYLDTGGYDTFPELVQCYVKLAQVFIVVMNHNCAKSSACAKRIVEDIRRTRGAVPILCVSTKRDLIRDDDSSRAVDCGATEHIICSSKLNIGINKVRQFVRHAVFSPDALSTSKKSKAKHFRELLPFGKVKAKKPALKATHDSPSLWRSSSQPDCSLNPIIPWKSKSASNSPRSSQTSLCKLPLSQSTHLNEIYRKYGYQRRVDSASPLSASIGNIASNVKNSTNLLVKNVQGTFSRLTAA